VTPAQLAWLHRVRRIAQEVLVPRYSPAALRSAIPKLRQLLNAPENARHVPRILVECGIRYMLVESIGNAKVDGVCFWLKDGTAPVVGMSFRFDRIDNFWFVLRHELEHVLQGHGRAAMMLDAELEGDRAGAGPGVSEEERIANEAAADFCVPRDKLRKFVAVKAPLFPERDMIGFARTLRVHPGIVAGQLRHATGRYELFAKHLAKVRFAVAPTATVDGWGDVVPLEQ
jgi:HTH-type transcriptional regulator/antitoxin HigA